MSALRQALALAAPAGVRLRDRVDADLPFLEGLYASTREEELRPVPWPDAQKLAFLADQFRKQHLHYLAHYPGALWLVVERDGAPAGRIYLWETPPEVRLMDIALVATQRGHGLGTALLQGLAAHADATGKVVSLHVEPYNPAMRLYRRLGYVDVETRGYYQYMTRQPRVS